MARGEGGPANSEAVVEEVNTAEVAAAAMTEEIEREIEQHEPVEQVETSAAEEIIEEETPSVEGAESEPDAGGDAGPVSDEEVVNETVEPEATEVEAEEQVEVVDGVAQAEADSDRSIDEHVDEQDVPDEEEVPQSEPVEEEQPVEPVADAPAVSEEEQEEGVQPENPDQEPREGVELTPFEKRKERNAKYTKGNNLQGFRLCRAGDIDPETPVYVMVIGDDQECRNERDIREVMNERDLRGEVVPLRPLKPIIRGVKEIVGFS